MLKYKITKGAIKNSNLTKIKLFIRRRNERK